MTRGLPGEEVAEEMRISAVLVTGAPGVGKTSALVQLVNSLPDDAVPAVIVHDFVLGFGVSPPPKFDRRCYYEETYDPGSGRECKGFHDLLRAILSGSGADGRATHLLVETAGLSDAAFFTEVFQEPEFARSFRLDGVIAVADPERLLPLLQGDVGAGGGGCGTLDQAARRQLAAASIICLNPTETDDPATETRQQRATDGWDSAEEMSTSDPGNGIGNGISGGGGGADGGAAAEEEDQDPHIAITGIQAASGVAAAGAGAAGNVVTHLAATTVSLASIGAQAVTSVTVDAWHTLSSLVELNVQRTWEGVCNLTTSALNHSATVVDVGIEGAAAVAHEAVALASVTAETATMLTAASIDAAASLPAASIGVVAASASVAGAAGAVLAGAVINTAGFAAGAVGLIDGSPLQTALRAAAPQAVYITLPLVRPPQRGEGGAAAAAVGRSSRRMSVGRRSSVGSAGAGEAGASGQSEPSPGPALWALIESEGSFAAASARRAALTQPENGSSAADSSGAVVARVSSSSFSYGSPAAGVAPLSPLAMSPGFMATADEEEDDGRVTWRCRELAPTGVVLRKVDDWLRPLITSGALLRIRGSLTLRASEDPSQLSSGPQSADPAAAAAAASSSRGAWCDDGTVRPHTFIVSGGGGGGGPPRSGSSFRLSGTGGGRAPDNGDRATAAGRVLSSPSKGRLAAEGNARRASDTGFPAEKDAGGACPPGEVRRSSSTGHDLSHAAGDSGGGGGDPSRWAQADAHEEERQTHPHPPERKLLSFRAPRRSFQNIFDSLDKASQSGGQSTLLLTDGATDASGGAWGQRPNGSHAGAEEESTLKRKTGEAAARASSGAASEAPVLAPGSPQRAAPPRPKGLPRPPSCSGRRAAEVDAPSARPSALEISAAGATDAEGAPAQAYRIEINAAYGRPFLLRVAPASSAPVGLLLVGRRLDHASLRAELSGCYVPDGFLPACASAALPSKDSAGGGMEVELDNGTRVALWRVAGRVVAVAAECPHAGAALANGTIVDVEDMDQLLLTCPRHKFTWDVTDGRPVSALGCGPVATYPVEEMLGNVYVGKEPRAAPPPLRRRSNAVARF